MKQIWSKGVVEIFLGKWAKPAMKRPFEFDKRLMAKMSKTACSNWSAYNIICKLTFKVKKIFSNQKNKRMWAMKTSFMVWSLLRTMNSFLDIFQRTKDQSIENHDFDLKSKN